MTDCVLSSVWLPHLLLPAVPCFGPVECLFRYYICIRARTSLACNSCCRCCLLTASTTMELVSPVVLRRLAGSLMRISKQQPAEQSLQRTQSRHITLQRQQQPVVATTAAAVGHHSSGRMCRLAQAAAAAAVVPSISVCLEVVVVVLWLCLLCPLVAQLAVCVSCLSC